MEVLKEHNGYQLIERYDNYYIRFWGGKEFTPYEIPISESVAEKIIEKASVIDEAITAAKAEIMWTASSFYRIGILEYLLHYVKDTQKRAEESYEILARHPDILKEFYLWIMNDEVFAKRPIKVKGYTAKYLASHYPLSVLGAYNYLIYLREKPEEALANLKAGLRNRDSDIAKILATLDVVAQKTSERETPTNIICYYKTSLIRSINSLDKWYSQLIALNCVNIEYVQIADSSDRFSEGDSALDFSSNDIPSSIANVIKEIGANSVLIRVLYRGKYFSILIRVNGWEIAIASNKENRKMFYSLAKELGFENKKDEVLRL